MRRFIDLIETAQRPNPYDDTIWYRGTNQPGQLSIGDGRNGDMLGRGFYLTNSPEYAAKFGKHVEEFQVMLGAVLDDEKAPRPNGRMMTGEELNTYARKNGYQAILSSVGDGVYQLCVLDIDLVNPFEGW